MHYDRPKAIQFYSFFNLAAIETVLYKWNSSGANILFAICKFNNIFYIKILI